MEWTMRQKKDIVRGRHSFCWWEQPQWSDISAVLQISRHLTDEYCYRPTRSGRNMKYKLLWASGHSTSNLSLTSFASTPIALSSNSFVPSSSAGLPRITRGSLLFVLAPSTGNLPLSSFTFLPIAPSSRSFISSFPDLPRDNRVSLSFT